MAPQPGGRKEAVPRLGGVAGPGAAALVPGVWGWEGGTRALLIQRDFTKIPGFVPGCCSSKVTWVKVS